jgi:hypothetical protein
MNNIIYHLVFRDKIGALDMNFYKKIGIFVLGVFFQNLEKIFNFTTKKKVYPIFSQFFCQKMKEFVGRKNCWSWILKVQFQHFLGLGFRSVQNMKVLT